ncbi:flavodoxin domain-containing protein [Cellulomonas sp. PS-H5]|uniref:flavodoxin domain-containing protein n=1 Tax=Cellulomonas sp. PS-H5 TaxID=2820400 RepID=UPI001C4F7CF2|nr:flavodoxin domain-containing protein [Cellulomonas sp. PS-H5]MBW0254248.1 flavodoxin domain-containing protein [Cellulomonas sp. PS-H5]
MRVLVTVASRHGSTREIGVEVAEVLRAAGHDVVEADPDEVDAVDGYDAVVLGSAVYVGRLAAALRELVDRQGAQLAARPTWLFWSGRVGEPPLPAAEPDDVRVVARRVAARGVAAFGGRLQRDELGLAERALVAMIEAEAGDFRDFDEVDVWAARVADELRRIERGGRVAQG